MQKEIISKTPVLTDDGRPTAGFARNGNVMIYERNKIHASCFRIKEWDWYQVSNSRFALQFTIGHASYAGQVGIMLFDFTTGKMIINKSKLLLLPFSSLHLEANAETDGSLSYHKGGVVLNFSVNGMTRRITADWDDVHTDVTLERTTPDSLVISLPFNEDPHQFYYNQKINCMNAHGMVQCAAGEFIFEKEKSFGLLDWGRGVWPFHNEWYWSNGTGYVNGKMIGFNLGCGFGNPSEATENCFIYDGKFCKLGKVSFACDTSDYMKPWTIEDEEHTLHLTLTPCYDRMTATKAAWIDNCTHQMFGSFSGTIQIAGGETVAVDNVVSFAEHAVNNW